MTMQPDTVHRSERPCRLSCTVIILLAGLLIGLLVVSYPAVACKINITSDPSQGALVYIFDVDDGDYIVNGDDVDSYNNNVPCDHTYRVWVEKNGQRYDVKNIPNDWTEQPNGVAEGVADSTEPLHFTLACSPPTASAGSNQTICETDLVALSGSATNYSSIAWTTSGDGSFGDATALSTTYTPGSGDISAGSVTLTLTAEPIAPCSTAASDDLVVTIQQDPTTAAGGNQTICDTDLASLSGSATNYASVAWTTSGDGSFGNAGSLTTDYTPGSGDLSAGSVTLTLTAQPIGPCGTPASDDLVVTLQGSPSAAAGSNVSICDTAMVFLSGSASDYSTILWTTSGDGSFANPAALTTDYTPGSGDIAAGTVTLTLTAQPLFPCGTPASDDLVVTIQASPSSAAGGDVTICDTESAALSGSATDYASVGWTTSGDGSFLNSGSLTTDYTPGSGDLAAGTVTLTLTAQPIGPCGAPASDDLVVTIQASPTSAAGGDVTICDTESATLSGSATDFASVGWTTSGDGSFGNAGSLSTSYTPGSGDLAAGTVTLTLTAQPIGPCGTPASDDLVVTIQASPTSAAGGDVIICDTESAALSGSATDYASVGWTTSGDGSFGNAGSLTTDYTPGSGDLAAGTVTLTLTAQPIGPCGLPASDSMIVTIQPAPAVVAGSNFTICDSDVAELAATASNVLSVLWTTSGDGSFGSASSLITDYTPGSGDVSDGAVTLTVTVQPVSPCAAPVSDELILTVEMCNDPPEAENFRVQTCAVGTGGVPEDEWVTFEVTVTDPDIDPFVATISPNFHEIEFPADELTVRFGSVWGELTEVDYGPGSTASVALTYVPPPGFIGEDTVTYVAVDPFGESTTGTVTIEVLDCREGGGGTASGIVINEVAWAGTEHSAEHEWMELHNTKYGTGESAIDLDGWVLAWRQRRGVEMTIEIIRDLDEFRALTPEEERQEIVLEGRVEPGGFYLLERHVEDVVSDMDAELVYGDLVPYDPTAYRLSDILGDEIYLFDEDGDRVSSANTDYTQRPPGGEPWPGGPLVEGALPFASMERLEFGEDEFDFDEHWDTNRGIIVFGVDASLVLLTATADHMNEAAVIKRLRDAPLDWLTVQQGDPVTLSFALRDQAEDDENPPWVTLFAVDAVMGGGGQLDSTEFVNVRRVLETRGLVPNFVIELDTSLLPTGSYELFVALGQGVFHAVGVRVI